ncbi:MAG: LytR C-terminal domain-containing protein [Georgenia sp.]
MIATATSDAERRRQARRHRLQQRQTIIFGGLITALLLVGLIALAMWSGVLPAPFGRDFSRPAPKADAVVVPCVPEGAIPVAFTEITANVYNGTDRAGLAGETGQALVQLGVVVNQQANWPDPYEEAVLIRVGPLGVTAGYSAARLFPAATVTLDSTRTDETIDVVLGSAYTAMAAPEEAAALDPAAPLASPEGCTPVETQPAEEPAAT